MYYERMSINYYLIHNWEKNEIKKKSIQSIKGGKMRHDEWEMKVRKNYTKTVKVICIM